MVQAGDREMLRETVDIDGEPMDVLHNAELSDDQWAEYKDYLKSNPYEAKRMLEEETNPDTVRRKNIMNAIADVWRKTMEDDPDDFARKIKALEDDAEFANLFEDLKAYRWDEVQDHLMNKDLMQKVSRRMGGVPREAKLQVDKERKTPLTLQEACKFGDLRAIQSYLSQTESCKEDREVDAQDHRGITCLGYAVGANRMNIAKLLIESNADPAKVDAEGNSGLHYAAAYGRKEMVDYMLNLGLAVDGKNSAGLTPLACGTRNKQKVTMQQLTERGGS